MGDHDYGRALLPVYSCQEPHDAVCRFRVEVARRLVGDYHLRPVEQGPCYRHPLLLPAGELVRHLVCLVLHAHGIEHFLYSSVYFLSVIPSGGLQHEGEIVLHAPVHQQLEVLEHHAELAPEIRYLLFPDAAEVIAADRALSFGKPVFGNDGPDDGCLPGSDLSHDVYEISRTDLHVQPVDDDVVPSGDVRPFKRDDRFLFFHIQSLLNGQIYAEAESRTNFICSAEALQYMWTFVQI